MRGVWENSAVDGMRIVQAGLGGEGRVVALHYPPSAMGSWLAGTGWLNVVGSVHPCPVDCRSPRQRAGEEVRGKMARWLLKGTRLVAA